MTKDYGYKRSGRAKSSAPHQFLVITVTFLLGYLTASFLDIQKLGLWMNNQVVALNEAEHKTAVPKHTALPPKPKFEFYTLLANEKTQSAAATHAKATTPAEQAASSAVIAAKPKPTPTAQVAEGKPLTPISKGSAYLVQVASFKARNDAEHMKGLLILKGFDVKVAPVVTPTQGSWFRVVVGPYPNRAQAQKAQLLLAQREKLKGMVRTAEG